MGMVPFSAAPLFLEGIRAPFNGKMLQLGRQDIYFSRDEFFAAAALCNFVPSEGPPLPTVSLRPAYDKDVLSDTEFFQRLGFDEVFALDFYDDKQHHSIVADLNADTAILGHENTFDFVLDGGTMEHIFHVPNVLANIHRLLKVGGRVMHFVPASNMVGHGFYSFSPCLFIDYYEANHYKIHSVQLQRLKPAALSESWVLDLYPSNADLDNCLMQGGSLDDFAYNLLVVAEKLESSTCGQIPTQGLYRKPLPTPEELQASRSAFPQEDGRCVFPWRKLRCLPA